MKKDPLIFISHVSDSINNIESFSKNLSKDKFIKDKLRQSAIIRQLEIIGEATKNLPLEFRKKYPETKWKEIAGLRDKITHHYFGINLNIVWEVVEKDIPKLKENIKNILDDLKEENSNKT
ncbi:MAG: DUF86 domain-containing protein [archaeon]